MSKLSVIARAVAVFNALHNEKFTEAKAESFMSCLEMVKAQQHEVPQLHAAEGEALLNAVGRAVAANQPIDLIYDGKTIHIDPAMTLADAFAHAEYVLKLNDRFPSGGEPLVQLAGRGTRPVVLQEVLEAPADPTPDLKELMARAVEEPELTEQQKEVVSQVVHAPQLGRGMRMMQGKTVDAMTLDYADTLKQVTKRNRPAYVRITEGPILQQQRNETVEQVIERVMPLAPLRVRISGLLMTVQDGYTTAEMIEEAHYRIANRMSDEEPGEFKKLEFEEEQLSDGTLRTAQRCWRRGYRYRLWVKPHDLTKQAAYCIHMKERPTQGYMDQHLELMYQKQGQVFLDITNGFDRFENITHFYCTSAGRRGISELANIEKAMHEEFVQKGGSFYEVETGAGKTLRVQKSPEVQAIEKRNSAAKGPYYSESWEDDDCGYRVKYWDTTEGKWRYTYFPTQPNGMATQIRNVKGHPASIEKRSDIQGTVTKAPK